MNRRKFCVSLASFSALFTAPSLAIPRIGTVPEERATLPITDEIRALEDYVRARPGEFSWWAHNELRHQYLPISERMSRKHADILLANSIMDEYILNTLSDWHLTGWSIPRDPARAIVVLLDNAEQYGFFAHLKAACQIRAADTYRELFMHSEANLLYRSVLDGGMLSLTSIPTLKPYRLLARIRHCN